MSVTPKLSTAIRSRIERRDRQAQTAFPAKVLSWSSSTNTVELEPQFVETWVTRDGERQSETGDATIKNVPVCYPRYLSWDITVGEFGLVTCTKYSLDQWRQQRRRMDPGDLRRFTMSGATFHPVLMDETPGSGKKKLHLGETLQSVIKTALSDFRTAIGQITATGINHTTSQADLATAITDFNNAATAALSKVSVE